jgi:hypothetical protein
MLKPIPSKQLDVVPSTSAPKAYTFWLSPLSQIQNAREKTAAMCRTKKYATNTEGA